MLGASICSCLTNFTSAIIYYCILSKTNSVASGDFHRSSTPWMIFQGRIHVWSESALAPPFGHINHANSAYFRLFWGYFGVISATRPTLLDLGLPFLHILDPSLIFLCTLLRLKIFSQFVTAESLGTLSLYAPTPPLWISSDCVFSFFCADFVDCPTIDFCHVHDFIRVPCSGERLHRPILSRIWV